jgi:hypothetical protein
VLYFNQTGIPVTQDAVDAIVKAYISVGGRWGGALLGRIDRVWWVGLGWEDRVGQG